MRKATFLILCLEGAILSFNVAASAALIPSISKEFGISDFITGKIVWFYMVPYGLAALCYGPLVRVFEVKKLELSCFFLFSLANLMAGLSKNIQMLFLSRFFMGIFGASVVPLILILIAHYIPEEDRGKQVGIFFSATFIASLLGLFLSAVIHWRLIFLIPALAGFLLWFFIYSYLPRFRQQAGGFKINYLAALQNKKIIFLFTYIFLVSLLYHGIQQWLGVYFSSRFNFSQFLISTLLALTSLSGIFGEVLGGWLSDSLGRIRIVNLGIVIMVLSVFLLNFKLPFLILSAIMILWGLGWTFNHAGLSTILTDLPREFLNEAASLNSSVRFLSGGLGVVISGWLMQRGFILGFTIFGVSLLGLLFSSKLLRISLAN